jgi:hypothetical protein
VGQSCLHLGYIFDSVYDSCPFGTGPPSGAKFTGHTSLGAALKGSIPIGQMSERTQKPCFPVTYRTHRQAMAALAAGISKQRAAAQGLGSNQNAVKYLGQDFETLRKQCLNSGVLFKDPEFPACPSALGYRDLGPGSAETQGIIWKRPTVRQ